MFTASCVRNFIAFFSLFLCMNIGVRPNSNNNHSSVEIIRFLRLDFFAMTQTCLTSNTISFPFHLPPPAKGINYCHLLGVENTDYEPLILSRAKLIIVEKSSERKHVGNFPDLLD